MKKIETFNKYYGNSKKWICLPMVVLLISCTNTINQQLHSQSAESRQAPNILFISIDDLRPALGSYGDSLAVTPNLDKLAAQGIRFDRAFAQQSICGPSRASIMTGMRPDSLGVTHNYVKFRDNQPDVVTIPQFFMNKGYDAIYVGKIFHHGDKDDALSWNMQAATELLDNKLAKPKRYAYANNKAIQKKNRKLMFEKYGNDAKFGLGSGPAFETVNTPDTSYLDGYNTELAIATIEKIAAKNKLNPQSSKPLFFGFGMNKPHLPWIAPKKYWDLYKREDIANAVKQVNTEKPKQGASMGLHASFELRTFYNIPNYGELSDELSIDLYHAYMASVSYVDEQVGAIIETYQQANMLDNTIIIVWSDHGYHLGEMGIWGKASNYEIANRVPLIISTPQMRQQNLGTVSQSLVELVDIYPTLVDLAGYDIPTTLDGKSVVPIINNPKTTIKNVALSQFPSPALREWGAYPLREGMRKTYFGPLIKDVEESIQAQFPKRWERQLFEQNLMGYSLRTNKHRMVVWLDTQKQAQAPLYIELYNLSDGSYEQENIASEEKALVADLIAELEVLIGRDVLLNSDLALE